MKRNLLPTCLLAGLCMAVAGCSDDEYRKPDYSQPASNTIAFDCRAVWGADNQTVWGNNDRIGFFCEQTGDVNKELSAAAISVGETSGLFYTRQPWKAGGEIICSTSIRPITATIVRRNFPEP